MTTGLRTFDAFGWQSLLTGRNMLVLADSPADAAPYVGACEEAGAAVTLAQGESAALQWLDRQRYDGMIVVSPGLLTGAPQLRQRSAASIEYLYIVAGRTQRKALSALASGAVFIEPGTSGRDIALIVARQTDCL